MTDSSKGIFGYRLIFFVILGSTPNIPISISPAPTKCICENARRDLSELSYPPKCWNYAYLIFYNGVVSGPSLTKLNGT